MTNNKQPDADSEWLRLQCGMAVHLPAPPITMLWCDQKKLLVVADRLEQQQARIAELEYLLKSIAAWDHLDSASDGSYWRQTIRAALATPTTGRTAGENV